MGQSPTVLQGMGEGRKGGNRRQGQSRRTRGPGRAHAEGERQLWAAHRADAVGSGKDRTGTIPGHPERPPAHTGNTGNRRDAAKPALVSA